MTRWYAYCAPALRSAADLILANFPDAAEGVERIETSTAMTPDMGVILINADLVDNPFDNPPMDFGPRPTCPSCGATAQHWTWCITRQFTPPANPFLLGGIL